MSTKLSVQSQLIDNYFLSEVVAPQKTFQAVQTDTGLALLFSIGSDSVFYLIQQEQGTRSGWKKTNLSSTLGTVKTFHVAQNKSNGAIDIAIVTTDGNHDKVFLSLNNPASGTTLNPSELKWKEVPYDDSSKPIDQLTVDSVFISESNVSEYIVIDLLGTNNFIDRYYLKPDNELGSVWNFMNIGGQLNPGVQSALGRKGGDIVDGMYNLGEISNNKKKTEELLYLQLYNPYGGTPSETRLTRPKGSTELATVITDAATGETALFVSGGGTLTYFAGENQQLNAVGTAVLQHPLFDDVQKIFAYLGDGVIVVWGINRANTVFYTECPIDKVSDPSAWSCPIPIMTQVDQVSPFINRGNKANMFFAVAGNNLKIATQSPQSTLWNIESVSLAQPNTKAKKELTYMSTFVATDATGKPKVQTSLMVSAASRARFYINDLYYVLDKEPIPVSTDGRGRLTIIEKVTGITGTNVTVSNGNGVSLTSNPVHGTLEKAFALNSKEKLRNATVPKMDGSRPPLIPSGTSDGDLNIAVTAIGNLQNAYKQCSAHPNVEYDQLQIIANSFPEAIAAEAGNLYAWMVSGVKHTIQVIQDKATGAWSILVTIAGKIYHALLNGIEKVAGALRWIFNALKAAINDLLDFLKHLFEWKEIWKTHEVVAQIMTNGISYLSKETASESSGFKEHINDAISTISDKFPTLELPEKYKSKTIQSYVNQLDPKLVSIVHSSEIDWIVRNLLHCAPSIATVDAETLGSNPLTDLVTKDFPEILKNTVLPKIKDLFKDKEHLYATFLNSDLTLETMFDFLKQLGSEMLTVIKDVLNKLLELAESAVSYISDALVGALEIPFISELYETLSNFFGKGEKLNVINGITFLIAIPATAIFSAAKGHAPFANGAQGLDNPDLFAQLFHFVSNPDAELLQMMSFEDVYNEICHPIGGAIALLKDAIAGVVDFSNTNLFFEVFVAGMDVLVTALTVEIPEGISPWYYTPKWAADLILNLIIGIPVGFIPEPGAAIGNLIITLLDIPFYLFTDIAIPVVKGADEFANWLPLILDSAVILGNTIGDIGLIANGLGQDSVFVGAELSWLIPIGIVVGGIGFSISALSDTAGLVTEIVME